MKTLNINSFFYNANTDHAMFFDCDLDTYIHVWGVKSDKVVVKKNLKTGNGRGQAKISSKKVVEAYVDYVKSAI
ncbi:hypothetical protein KNT86_gp015 [Enterobacteria phage vB_EcoM_IME341]|uniref:Uncharacterized protein n=2 Tax=Dhakavirus TaxID=1914165 RepID=A0A2S1GRF0_9CAUD|nr:hypothetical protein KNT86_gp015 [Enterobacteria phage vB_EcoM_IME341]YP_010100386.1 hypothetical protein KNU29_gp183 [Escherichia phage AnYang]AWD91942.1 hypothetical protein [Enterobacteria phage vB_EcoM_IME341]QAU03701.1 hypothetical protein [Escherichia phage AnYang]WQZ01035.1 hypothetical protein 04086_4584 [Escherichia phage 04086]